MKQPELGEKVTYRTPTISAGSAGTTTGNVAIAKPTSLRVGDLIILVVTSDAPVVVMPDGFSKVITPIVQGVVNVGVWYKFAANGEPATYDVEFSAVGDVLYNLSIVRGVDPFVVFEADEWSAGSAGLPVAEPGVTTTVDNCLAVAILAFAGSPRGLVVPTGWTVLESRDGAAGTVSQAIGTKTIAAAGSSGGATWTATDSSPGDHAAVTLAIRPGVMSLANSIEYEPQQLLAKTLADCSEFRNLVVATDHDSAQAKIWHESLPRPADGRETYTLAEMTAYRPFALIFTNDLDGAMATRQAASPGAWRGQGALRILLEIDTPDDLADSPVLLDQLMKQLVGRIRKRPTDEAATFYGLQDLAHRTNEVDGYSYLAIDTVSFRGYHRSNQRDQPGQGDYLFAWLEVLWGRGS